MSKTTEKPVTASDLAKKEAELIKALEELKNARAAKEAEEAAAEAARLEEARQKKIAAILKTAGVDSVDALIAFVKPPKAKKRKTERKARTLITPEMKAAIIADIVAGKINKTEIARRYGVSYPTVINYSKESQNQPESTKETVAQPAQTPVETAA